MSGLEYFLLFIGFIFIVVSLFLIDRKKDDENKQTLADADVIFPEEEMEKILQDVNRRLESVADHYVIDTDDKLSTLSNEKIIAINDYAQQLLAKLESNHQEVIFLYNMLQEKEGDMKATLNRMEVMRRENQVLMEKLEEIRNRKKNTNQAPKEGSTPKDSKAFRSASQNNDVVQKQVPYKELFKPDETKQQESEQQKSADETDNKNEAILKLHRENKSLIEISRILGIGQGEVKLVIDLYAKKV